MKRLTIHIGAPKCGSSALQAGLTHDPVFVGRDGVTFTYAIIDHEGRVRSGAELLPDPVYGYRSMVDMSHILQNDDAAFAEMRHVLADIANPVLSNEGMMGSSADAEKVLNKLDFPVDLVMYIRPQVDFVNSAWWQWGAWANRDEATMLENMIRLGDYHLHLSNWARVPQVQSVTLRLMPPDIVTDFRAVLGADPAPPPFPPRINASLPAAVLRLAQRHPDLHRRLGPQLDFVLAQRMSFDGLAGTPWVINTQMAERIIARHRAGNLDIIRQLDPASAAMMSDDPRWWDGGAYAGRNATPPGLVPADSDEGDLLALRLIEALLANDPPIPSSDLSPDPAPDMSVTPQE